MSGKITLNLAISLDGYIADENGGYEWIDGDGDSSLNTEGYIFEEYFKEFVDNIDVVLMGRDCYERGMAEPYTSKMVYVATSSPQKDKDNLKFIGGDIIPILQAEKNAGKNIFLFGGGKTIDPFIKSDIIDEYIIGIIPVILGDGRRLFFENNPTVKLNLKSCTLNNGVVMLKYSKRP